MAVPVPTRYKEALRRGHLAVVKGRPREAVDHYREAGALAGDRPLPFVAMGNVFLEMRQVREALAAFDEALARAPGDLEALRGKARALAAGGEPAEAAKLMRRAEELEAMARAGRPAGTPNDQRTLELEHHVREGLRARRADDLGRAVLAFMAAAEGYAQQDRLDLALDACLRALEAIPSAIDVHLLMARIYLRRGWGPLGVERVRLIDHRLSIDEDPRRRAVLRSIVQEHRDLDPALARIAAGG